ncbi:MAG: AAA family ATPase [Gammaproteobacteria bacterium]|nr:AAA family ATPase [Gammaproteobacteria bacterium]
MYTSFFGLNEKPFSITPDPRYLFMSERHTEALAHLIYGVQESGGFIQLTGEVGTGKTTLVRSLLQQIPDNADIAVILNPQVSRNEFLTAICEELGVPLPDSVNNIKTLTSALNAYLLNNHSQGKRTIVIVDEAQNLRIDVLEQVRLLTNLETTKQKLLQIILIGQPELREVLSRNDMRQLAQRITGRYHLEPLSKEETLTYIDHRLKVAGAVGQIFTRAAKLELYRLSQGVPRMINVIADRAMLGAFTQDSREISPALLRQAAVEVFGKDGQPATLWRRQFGPVAAALAIVLLAAISAWALFDKNTSATNDIIPQTRSSLQSFDQPVSSQNEATAIAAPKATTPAPKKPVTTPPAAGPNASLGKVLSDNRATTDTDSAFAQLFALWSTDYTRGTASACQQAQNKGLYCLFQRGSLSQVRSLNRPVILTLRDTNSQAHQIVMSGLSGNTASVMIDNKTYRISSAELDQFWFGEYLLLWQPQIDKPKQFVPGMRDEDVRWLRESLAEIQGKPIAPMDSDLFDSDLEARVRDYQRERRLSIDGLVGYQTQIAINSDLNSITGPRLVRAN